MALGGLADLLTPSAGTRSRHEPDTVRLTDDQQTAAAIRHVLSIAYVTARHAIDCLPIVDADRPLRIAQYADRALQDLAHISAHPNTYQQLQLVTSVHRTSPITAWPVNSSDAQRRTNPGSATASSAVTVPESRLIRRGPAADTAAFTLRTTAVTLGVRMESARKW